MLSSSLSTSCLISITFEMVDLSIQGSLIGNNQNHNSYSVVQKISKPFISMDMVSLFRHTLTLPHLSHSSDIVAVQMINICFPPLKIENPPYIHKSRSSGFKIQENSIYAFLLFATCQRKSWLLCYQHEQNFHKDRHLLCSVKYKRSIYIVYTEMLAAPILKISVNRLVLERNGKKKRKTKSIQSTKEHV